MKAEWDLVSVCIVPRQPGYLSVALLLSALNANVTWFSIAQQSNRLDDSM